MDRIMFSCPWCMHALTFNDILNVEINDEAERANCPDCKIHISNEEISRQIRSKVIERIGLILVSK